MKEAKEKLRIVTNPKPVYMAQMERFELSKSL